MVELGPKLSGLWNMPTDWNKNNSHFENIQDRISFSMSILTDQLEISSNLYQQKYAWEEMSRTNSTRHATELIRTNEHLALRSTFSQ